VCSSDLGCRTGFHLIVWGEPQPAEVAAAIKASLADIAERVTWEDVPGTDAKSCGNYRDHSLHSAQEWCRAVLAQGISIDPFDRSVLA
jgi:S-ribosylhomocysteine lyase